MQVAKNCRKVILISRQSSSLIVRNWTHSEASEYVDTPNYPPILDLSEKSVKQREKDDWHTKIAELGCYEQKMMELNMPKAYGYWSCLLNDSEYHVNGVPFLKFITRTAVTDGLPKHYYKDVEGPAAVAAERLAPLVEQAITNCYHARAETISDEQKKSQFLSDLQRLLKSCLPRATQTKVSWNPHMKSWWFAGGLDDPGIERREWQHLSEEKRIHKLYVRNLWLDQEDPFMGDRPISSSTQPEVVIRERHGLPEVESRILGDAECSALEEVQEQEQQLIQVKEQQQEQFKEDVQHESYQQPKHASHNLHPEVYGYKFDHKAVVILPGYLPGEPYRYGRLFYHDRSTVTAQEEKAAADAAEWRALKGQEGPSPTTESTEAPVASPQTVHKLLIAAHTQGLSHAALLGFGPVTELSYPLVQQSAVTDGRTWNIALHQLNSVALHSDRTVNNPARNRLWVTGAAQLWTSLDPSTGAVLGFNRQLLASLVTLYMKEPRPRRKDETPHLAEYKHLWKHPAVPWYRQLFHEHSQKFFSGRKWFIRKPEIDAYEMIYRLEFDTMPELKNNKRFYDGARFRLLPQDRTLKMYKPMGIPVHSRPLGKKDPIKREPLLNPETLYTSRYKIFRNKGYAKRYLALMPYR